MQMKFKAMRLADDNYVVCQDISHAVVRHGVTHFDVQSCILTADEFNKKYSFVTVEIEGKLIDVEVKN